MYNNICVVSSDLSATSFFEKLNTENVHSILDLNQIHFYCFDLLIAISQRPNCDVCGFVIFYPLFIRTYLTNILI